MYTEPSLFKHDECQNVLFPSSHSPFARPPHTLLSRRMADSPFQRESVRAGDETGDRCRHRHRSAGGDRKRVGHFHSVSHRFMLPGLLRADRRCSTLDSPDRFAMIRWFRPATQGIRDLFTLQTSLGRLASSRRKHDCKAPPQDSQEPHRHSKSCLKNWPHRPEILLRRRKININSPDQGPFGVPKITGRNTKNPTMNEKSRVSYSSSRSKARISTLRKFPVYKKTSNKTRERLFRRGMIRIESGFNVHLGRVGSNQRGQPERPGCAHEAK
jgi:hypothetical protein